jgi:hypothetical protein
MADLVSKEGCKLVSKWRCDNSQLLNEVEHDMKNYQARSLPLSTEAEGWGW